MQFFKRRLKTKCSFSLWYYPLSSCLLILSCFYTNQRSVVAEHLIAPLVLIAMQETRYVDPYSFWWKNKKKWKRSKKQNFFWQLRQLKLKKSVIKRPDNWIYWVELIQRRNLVNLVKTWTRGNQRQHIWLPFLRAKKEEINHSFSHPSACTTKIYPATMKISTIRNRSFFFLKHTFE